MRKATDLTSITLAELIPAMLERLGQRVEEGGDLILAAWPEIIGDKLQSMTEAVAFENKTLHVKVKNATLYSLLAQHEKGRLLEALRKRFPRAAIQNIVFLRR